MAATWTDLHALIGAALWFYIAGSFHHCVHRSPAPEAADIQALCRHLCRVVYLLLYALLPITAAGDFRIDLSYGLLTLAMIHILAAVSRHVISHGAGHGPHPAQRNGRLT